MKVAKNLSLLVLFLAQSVSANSLLTAKAYLQQVEAGHVGIKASEMTSQGAQLKSKEADIILSPQAFFQTQILDDKSPKNNISLMGNHTEQLSSSLGIQKQHSTGLQSKLYYNLSHTNTEGASQVFLPQPNYYDGKFIVELNQPILRNGFGRETKATIEASEAKSLANHESEKFKIKLTKAEAEIIYWRLSINRAIVNIQKQSKERAQKIRDWNLKRSKLRLADNSDYIQSEALLKLRSIELQSAEDDLLHISSLFNSLRGVDSKEVPETTEDISELKIETLKMPENIGKREDLDTLYQQYRALSAAAKIADEKNSPSLDLFGSMALNGRDNDQSQTISESFRSDQSTYTVGVKLTVPLDFELMKNNSMGAKKEAMGSEMQYRRKQFVLAKEWNELARRFEETKRRYSLADELETIQKLKFQNEKTRHTAGRTTTFLVLQFEQDYATAQIQKLKAKLEVLNTLIQMNLFGGLK